VLKAVPQAYREGMLALGATRWQTIRMVVLPAARPGIIAAVILGMGRGGRRDYGSDNGGRQRHKNPGLSIGAG